MPFGSGGRDLSPQELDVGAIADAVLIHYIEAFFRDQPEVRHRLDPDVAAEARRRTAYDWGFVSADGWSDLVGSLDARQREALHRRLVEIDRALIEDLHGGVEEPR